MSIEELDKRLTVLEKLFESLDLKVARLEGAGMSEIARVVEEGFKNLIEYKEGAEKRITERQKTRPQPTSREVDWRAFKSGTPGGWTFSNNVPELVEKIREGGGKYSEGGYNYRLSGDDERFVQRFPIRRRKG